MKTSVSDFGGRVTFEISQRLQPITLVTYRVIADLFGDPLAMHLAEALLEATVLAALLKQRKTSLEMSGPPIQSGA